MERGIDEMDIVERAGEAFHALERRVAELEEKNKILEAKMTVTMENIRTLLLMIAM